MISIADQDGVRTVTLDRPDKRNALTPSMLAELPRAFMPSDATRVVVLQGSGRVFCAGFDLSLCRDDPPEQPTLRALLAGLHGTVVAMRHCPVPIVLAAHGAAIAGGAALLGGADVVVTDREAKLGYPVLPLGVSPAVSAPFLRLGIGDGGTRSAMLEPTLFSGAEAHRCGLAHHLTDSRDEVVPLAQTVAAGIAQKPAGGTTQTKAWLNLLDQHSTPDHTAGRDASLALVGSTESQELLRKAWTR